MNGSSGCLRVALLVLCLVAVGIIALFTLVHRDQHVGLGQEVVYDDFGFNVESVTSVPEVGPANARLAAATGERFVVVQLDVENHVRRVDYDLSMHIPRVEDADGGVYEVDAAATASLRAGIRAPADPKSIRAGMFWVSFIVFRVPADATGLRLRIGWREPIAGIDKLVSGDRTITLGQ